MQLTITDGGSIFDRNNNLIKKSLNSKASRFQQDKKFINMTVEVITMWFTNIWETINNLCHINKDSKFFSYFILMEFHL